VGRPELVELTQMKPTMMGKCIELVDDSSSKRDESFEASRNLVGKLEKTLKYMYGACYLTDYETANIRALNVLTEEQKDGEL
jgi:hypothetical protein